MTSKRNTLFPILAIVLLTLVQPLPVFAKDNNKPVKVLGKAVKSAPVDYSDVTGPILVNVTVDKLELDLMTKSSSLKILITVSDDLNSIDNAGACFARLNNNGQYTGSKLFCSLPKPSKRISSKILNGQRVEVFEMYSNFPKGLASGRYQILISDFWDLASNRRQDLQSTNGSK